MLKESIALLKEAGCSSITTTRGKHHKIKFKTPVGKQGFLVVSISTSDHNRALKNIQSNINNLIRSLDNDTNDARTTC